ncbi:MAG: alpha-amylase family glycosyl hydrolase [Sphingorhabdus sp.]
MRKTLAGLISASLFASPLAAQSFRDRLPEDEMIYFVLPDRFENGDPKNDTGGIKGDRLKHGFDPTHKGFYHGGDLKGLIQRLDYIQGMGITAIWFAPIFKNKPVQGPKSDESAGYHGYWVTDFTSVDPHFGSNAEFKAFVDAAHARGIKVYMDIITNHTADVIGYADGDANGWAYKNRADFPYSRRASDGKAINEGFKGDSIMTAENFAKLTDPNYAYTVRVPKGEERIKVPSWLNDPVYYHNRGNTTFTNESSTMGDFVGLDDLMTENPRVVQGFIDIYGDWIDRFGIDGFRIDTAKHVNPEFWAQFAPAMLARAKAKGIDNFHIFGEVANDGDVAIQAWHTKVAKLPSVLDFAFGRAVTDTVGGVRGTDMLARLLQDDELYAGGAEAAKQLPTFLGNHDTGRFSMFIRNHNPKASDEELLQRVILGHALMLTSRGVPTYYSGDEQGFISDGNDQAAREDMFPSKVASYNDNRLLGTKATTAQSNFDTAHPLYRTFAKLNALRREHHALRRGWTVVRNYSDKPGLFAFSRISGNEEVLMVFNTSNAPLKANVEVPTSTSQFSALIGKCPAAPRAPGSAAFELAPLDYAICTVK